MSSQPLLIREVGCCEYNWCEQCRELDPRTPFNMQRRTWDHDPDKSNDKFALQTAGLIISAVSLGIYCSLRNCSTGMKTFSGFAFMFHAMGICTLTYVINCDVTPPHLEDIYPPERTRCRSDTAIVYSIATLAFSIFTYMYISKDC